MGKSLGNIWISWLKRPLGNLIRSQLFVRNKEEVEAINKFIFEVPKLVKIMYQYWYRSICKNVWWEVIAWPRTCPTIDTGYTGLWGDWTTTTLTSYWPRNQGDPEFVCDWHFQNMYFISNILELLWHYKAFCLVLYCVNITHWYVTICTSNNVSWNHIKSG